jgi:hypothetical protein
MNYMTTHLWDAVKINYQRRPLYAKLTQGKSKKISNLMMTFEVISLPTSLWLDHQGKRWQKKGIPLMVHEFIPMEKTPAFSTSYPFAIPTLNELPIFDGKTLLSDLSRLFKEKNYLGIKSRSEEDLAQLAQWPHLHCMMRHILESLGRSAELTLRHIALAKELKLDFDLRASHFLIHGHIMAIPSSQMLDRLAFPLQNQGVPIIFQDVPPVAIEPESYP